MNKILFLQVFISLAFDILLLEISLLNLLSTTVDKEPLLITFLGTGFETERVSGSSLIKEDLEIDDLLFPFLVTFKENDFERDGLSKSLTELDLEIPGLGFPFDCTVADLEISCLRSPLTEADREIPLLLLTGTEADLHISCLRFPLTEAEREMPGLLGTFDCDLLLAFDPGIAEARRMPFPFGRENEPSSLCNKFPLLCLPSFLLLFDE